MGLASQELEAELLKFRHIYRIHRTFIEYLIWIIGIREENICIILDNCSVHWSRDTRNYLIKRKFSWFFLPQYTPEIAPVELFFCQLKRLISAKRLDSVVNLSRTTGKKFLIDAISSIDRFQISKIWSNFVLKLKELVSELDSIFEMEL